MKNIKNQLMLLRKNSWFIWFCGSLFYLYQFILRVSPSIIQDELISEFNIDGCTIGLLGSCFYKAYAVMLIPVGWLIDRLGIRRLLPIFCLITSLGSVVFALAGNLYWANIGRILIGGGSACAFIGVVNLIYLSFSKSYIPKVVGWTMMLGTIGAIIGSAPLAYLVELLNWRQALVIIGIIGLGLAVLLSLVLYNNSKLSIVNDKREEKYSLHKFSLLTDLGQILKNKQLWFLGLYGNLMYVPLAILPDLWGPNFLMATYNIDKKLAAFIISFIYIGTACGAPLIAYWSDNIKSYKIPMNICSFVAIFLYFAATYYQLPSLILLACLLFGGGLCFGGQCLVFSILSYITHKKNNGLSLAFLNTLMMGSGIIFEPLVGYLLDYSCCQSNVFTFADYKLALMVIPVSLVISLIVLRYIKEVRKR